MKDFDIYVITCSKISRLPNIMLVREAILGGCTIVQLREKEIGKEELRKQAFAIAKICKENDVMFIVNDYCDICNEADAGGVHLGQDDISVKEARAIIGDKIIGKSTHSLEQAINAAKEGADYISVGPIFETQFKDYTVGVELLKSAKEAVHIPIVAIGGINLNNVRQITEAGIRRAAAISSIVASDNPREAVAEFKKRLA